MAAKLNKPVANPVTELATHAPTRLKISVRRRPNRSAATVATSTTKMPSRVAAWALPWAAGPALNSRPAKVVSWDSRVPM